jgi:non-ribosomal peptide synthetase component E (peptide arylation enzyme)
MSEAGNAEMPRTLNAIISASAARHPGRPAILAEDNWSFGRLSAEADTVARSLSRLGVRRGDRVALRLAPSGRALVLHASAVSARSLVGGVEISTGTADPPALAMAASASAST